MDSDRIWLEWRRTGIRPARKPRLRPTNWGRWYLAFSHGGYTFSGEFANQAAACAFLCHYIPKV